MKRKLRPSIRYTLITITIMLAMFLACIDDFSLSAIPLIFGLLAVIIFNATILEKF